jgi:exosortase
MAALALLGGALVWAYWPVLCGMAQRWLDDPQYSHGYLVPAFAGVLLWLRRDKAPALGPRLSWWGIPVLAAGVALLLAGVHYYVTWLEGISLLPCLAGVALLLGGRPALRWAWPAVAFCAFMVPMPYRVQTALAGPLQGVATGVSTFFLQTLGLPALAEGNVIVLNDVRIGVVEACSGLTMLTTFLALATAVALVIKRPWTDRLVIVVSAVPIAVVANAIRITATGVLYDAVSSEAAHAVFHDWAGLLMMVVALALLGLVYKVLGWLLVKAEDARPLGVPLPGGKPAAASDP